MKELKLSGREMAVLKAIDYATGTFHLSSTWFLGVICYINMLVT